MQRHEDTWLSRFADRGYPSAQPLGAGMEGAVYRLDDAHVAKVWAGKSREELARMQTFYEQLAAAGLAFATPRFVELWELDGHSVTVEPRLPGAPLDSRCAVDGPVAPEAIECMLDVLTDIGSVALEAAASLRVLGASRTRCGRRQAHGRRRCKRSWIGGSRSSAIS